MIGTKTHVKTESFADFLSSGIMTKEKWRSRRTACFCFTNLCV